MDAYTSFAQVYDNFMDNIPYDEAIHYHHEILKKYNITEGLVAELGCGTGNLTMGLSNLGYDMIGIDNSADMLEIAEEKCRETNLDILYLLQDMCEFELYGTVQACISFCDSINYILMPEDLLQVFRLVNNYLDPQGIFIFDFHTPYYYEEELGDVTFAEDRQDMSLIWDNLYFPDIKINQYLLSIFVQEQEDLYRKYTEEHVQRAYSLEEIKSLLAKANLEFLAAYDEFSTKAPNSKSTRIHVVAREQGKA